jgi:hypothetical protein
MKQTETMKVISMGKLLDTPSPMDNVEWKITSSGLIALKGNNRNGTRKEIYFIAKEKCRTEERRIDWITHMCSKVWVSNYEFGQTMLKAKKVWKF